MNELFKIILSLSISGGLLILVLFLCRPFIKDKLSKRWQYYIWLIVIARLLFPFAPQTSLMATLFEHFDYAVRQADVSIQHEIAIPIFRETDDVSQQNRTDDSAVLGTERPLLRGVCGIIQQNIGAVVLLIWLIVAVGLLIRKVTIYQSFVKYIKAGRVEVSDLQLWEQVGKLVEQIGVKRGVGLYTNNLISSPLLIGFFRPCIMLPTTELSNTDFRYTIQHELTHYKRQDMLYKWLAQVTICIHWFNPLVYLMGNAVNRACELSCDEAIVRSLDEGGRRDYGNTLLNAVGVGGSYKDSLASVTLSESKKLLEERLKAIKKFDKKTKWKTAFGTSVMIAMLCAGYVLGAYTNFSNAIPLETDGQEIRDDYGLTVYAGGEDISHEIIRLWNNANHIYNVDDTQMFPMGEATFLYDDGPEYIEIFNYDQETDAVFTANGKKQLEQAAIGGPFKLIQKIDGRVYRMGPWKTGYSYADALDGIKVIRFAGNALILQVKYKKPLEKGESPVFGYVNLTAKKIHDEWRIENYVYPEIAIPF